MRVENRKGYELELGSESRKFFLKVLFEPFEIWVDFAGIPASAFLCAMFDGTEIMKSKVGSEGQYERTFVNIEWIINEWDADKEIIEAIKKRKQKIIDELPEMKEKYK